MRRFSWIPRRLDARLVLPGLAVALAIAALWWNLLDRLNREEHLLDHTARQNIAVVARLVEEHAIAIFRQVDDLLLDVTRSDQPVAALQLDDRRVLAEGVIVALRLYDAQGALRSASGHAVSGSGRACPSIAACEEFQRQRERPEQELVIAKPFVEEGTGRILIPLSRRITGPDGLFAGVAVADVPADMLSRFYAETGLPPDSAISLLRDDGQLLARHALQEQTVGKLYTDSQLWGHLSSRPAGTYRASSPVDGVERIYTYRRTGGYPLLVVVGESVEAAFGPWHESARLYIGAASVATLVILLFTTGFLMEFQRRRRFEKALGIRNHAMASSGDGILVADATVPGMPVLYGNPAVGRLMGLSLGEIAGRDMLEVLTGLLPGETALRPLREAVAAGREVTLEFPGVPPGSRAGGRTAAGKMDGEEDEWLELRASPVRDEAGRLVSLIATIRDIRDRKRNEAELVAAQREAERANIAKSTFLAAASHDLRQPVQSLLLLLEVLSSRTTDAVSRNVLGTMDRALGALKMLLDGLLDVSRLDAGAVTPELKTFPVNELLERIAASARPVAVRKNLLLHIVPCSAHVHSDPMLLGRILQNFAENALRYTDQGRILIGCRRVGAFLRLEVWDTGMGIPADRQEDIFQEFVQVGNAGRNRDQGLGLGLAVVRRLTQMLGYTVALRSEPGHGSVFSVLVPLAEAPAPPPAPVVEAAPVAAGTRVLVVEDDVIVREGLRATLREWGHAVQVADGREAALRLARLGAGPDIIVTDYRLQNGETGTEVIREVRRLLGRPVPSILVTGDTAPERLQEGEAGNFRVLHKPVIAYELRRAVAEALNALDRPQEPRLRESAQ